MNYKLIFSIKSYIKFQTYIKKKDTEISGLGKITLNKETGIFYVEDFVLLPQVATGASTIFDDGDYQTDNIMKGGSPSDYRCWWHSHVDMGVFWSGTDMSTIEDHDTKLPLDNWFISIVGNKKGEILCRLDIFDPIRITLDKLPWEIDFNDDVISALVDQEIKENFVDSIPIITKFNKQQKFWLKLQKQGENYFPRREIIIPDNFQ